METVIIQGIITGFVIAFPKGPAGLMVIRQTILTGFTSGIHVARGPIATTFISSIIILIFSSLDFDLVWIMDLRNNNVIHIIGGIILIGVGFYFLKGKKQEVKAKTLFWYTFLEPFLFPATIAIFIIISPETITGPVVMKTLFFIGIIIGTLSWYYISCKFFARFSQKNCTKIITILNNFFGWVFIIFGVVIILHLIPDIIERFFLKIVFYLIF
jgi:threonine/homoserine/homoserine lactone efflux protein